MVAEAPGKSNFPTMLSGGVQGQEKRRPKHKCCGKKWHRKDTTNDSKNGTNNGTNNDTKNDIKNGTAGTRY